MFVVGGFFMFWIVFVMVFALVPLSFLVYSLIEVARAPEAAFGPPWDNCRNAWLLGLAVAFVIPAGHIVGPIVWFVTGRGALRAGRVVPRPFWAPRPSMPAYPPGWTVAPQPPAAGEPPATPPA